MARLSKEAWGKPTLQTNEVEVPELGGTVLVRELPASFVAEINQHIQLKQIGREQISSIDLPTMERQKFAYGVIDDDGNQLFTEEEAGEIASNHGRAYKIVLDAIDELSEINEEGAEKAKARFPGGGVRQNGSVVSDPAPDGDGGSDLRVRTGARTENEPV